MTVLYIIKNTILLLIQATEILMFVRAILSWFPGDIDNAFTRFLYGYTEIVIAPMRALLDRFHLFESFPLDMAFFITFLLLVILRVFLV
ncbi:MAG: YggT family protein [Clostridia bacterium]|nr:YggT family protein [Clostridia bacterium]